LKYIQQNNSVSDWHKEWKARWTNTLTVSETTYGLATTLTVQCNRCKEMKFVVEATKK
jgi:hypothetical protein